MVEYMNTSTKEPRSTVVSDTEEAAVVTFRRHTTLPLDNCLYALQYSIPHLTRSSRYRCLQRHGMLLMPGVEKDKPKRQKFNHYPIDFFHINIAELQTAEPKIYLFVGIYPTNKYTIVQLWVTNAD